MKTIRTILLIITLIMVSFSLCAKDKKITSIQVITERVLYSNTTQLYTAWFGYYNANNLAVTIPAGDDNFLSHGTNMGQTTVFSPGRIVDAFSITWVGDRSLLWKVRTPGGSPSGYSTATAAMSVPFHDDDDDGVINNDDGYPTDPLRAYDVYTPGLGVYGTLAYEDLWPQKGDYDLNDLVLDYNFKMVTNAQNYIKDITATFKVRAVGASKVNGFAIEFPFPLSAVDVSSLVGKVGTQAYPMAFTNVSPRCILRVIVATTDLGITTMTPVFWNTQNEQPKYPDVNMSFSFTLNTPINPNLLPYSAPFNPFLIVDGVTGHEVHLPGKTPTALADASLFCTGDDDTRPTIGKYYKTVNNMPWALHIPVSFKYPIERKQITEAYLAFKPWAESNGTTNQNWYELISSQIDMSNIYNK